MIIELPLTNMLSIMRRLLRLLTEEKPALTIG